MTPRKILTDRAIKAAKPAKAGERNQISDGIVPGLALRITDNGAKSFVLVARYPGSTNPTRRALGSYGAISLDDARTKARDWLALLQQGIDPAEQEARERAEQARKRLNSFASMAEDFIREKLPTERAGKEIERLKDRRGSRVRRRSETNFSRAHARAARNNRCPAAGGWFSAFALRLLASPPPQPPGCRWYATRRDQPCLRTWGLKKPLARDAGYHSNSAPSAACAACWLRFPGRDSCSSYKPATPEWCSRRRQC